jgi:hypothetical protein
MLNKLQVIEGIREINPTARLDWLGRFDLGALRRYLEHLEVTLEPRGTCWERCGDTPAVVTARQVA